MRRRKVFSTAPKRFAISMAREEQPRSQSQRGNIDATVRTRPHQASPAGADTKHLTRPGHYQAMNRQRRKKNQQAGFHAVDTEKSRIFGVQTNQRQRQPARTAAQLQSLQNPEKQDHPRRQRPAAHQPEQPQNQIIRLIARQPGKRRRQENPQRRGERMQPFAGSKNEAVAGRQISTGAKRDPIILPRVLSIGCKHHANQQHRSRDQHLRLDCRRFHGREDRPPQPAVKVACAERP